jgi:dipeptidyl aminopeptidase/acylaminoacyl peptidase
MKKALDKAGKQSELVAYADWHGFYHEPNRVDLYTRIEKFLLECTAEAGKAA